MDAPQDRDIELQRASSELIDEFKEQLPSLLWKNRTRQPHRWAQATKTDSLIALLEPFQEWPQLLDPHLQGILAQLVDAFLLYLGKHRGLYASTPPIRSQRMGTIYPLPRAICKLLNVFYKVRGVKVISRFLNNEPKYLEPFLRTFIDWDSVQAENPSEAPTKGGVQPLTWEERYIMLLWLSHLLLAPFDLASLSSETIPIPYDNLSVLSGLSLQIPRVAHSILSISLKYVVLPGKEREAATTLLARLALRLDMQRLGLLDCLTQWAIGKLHPKTEQSPPPVYTCIGVLSFIARLGASGQVEDLAPFAAQLFNETLLLLEGDSAVCQAVQSSALARKIGIKILRTITELVLSLEEKLGSHITSDTVSMVLESSIDHFLVSLGDKDTPVRFAASKALSVITVRLDQSTAVDVIDAVLDSLNENILYEKQDGSLITRFEARSVDVKLRKRNLSAVDPQKWHGLILTLAHLLFRQSPPTAQLSQVLQSLVSGLDFEQRSSTGSSVGTSVRDAACFGIWALARKYTTEELQDLDAQELKGTTNQENGNTLQALAIELVCAACLDSAGNIRRGASAALQELIGRHPDTVSEGIPLVQVVDYHSVARRSRAMVEVAKGAASLSTEYWTPLVNGLLQWRGIGSPDAESRRVAANALGELSVQDSYKSLGIVLDKLVQKLTVTAPHAVEVRHGTLLSLAATIEAFIHHRASNTSAEDDMAARDVTIQISAIWKIFGSSIGPTEEGLTLSALRPDLTAEAAAHLLSALSRASNPACNYELYHKVTQPTDELLQKATDTLLLCVARADDIPIEASSEAASNLFLLLTDAQQSEIVSKWFANIHAGRKSETGRGQIAALGAVFPRISSSGDTRRHVVKKLIQCTGEEERIAKRVSAVKCIATEVLPHIDDKASLTPNLIVFLNDYTTDRRGDIGSLIRVEAIEAVNVILKSTLTPGTLPPPYLHGLLSCVVRLSAEKLDKVRFQAWKCLQKFWESSPDFPPLYKKFEHFSEVTTSAYFLQLFELLRINWLRQSLVKGMITSASTGTEGLVRSTRFALLEFIRNQDANTGQIISAHIFEDLLILLETCIDDDRYAIPTVEMLAFVLDHCFNQSDVDSTINYRKLFTLVQKSHFKSSNMPRIEAAIKIYSILWRVLSLRNEVTKKMMSMLLHPYPKIRTLVSDSLFIETGADEMKKEDWSTQPKELKGTVENLRRTLISA
ncbi:hypothetical protein AJ80_01388 [Polytolypa hystricis UAMH7299]|uniref:Uncharacterized protein n=1 Tax=Polytolypa hystricis (strain UAMH7299) TaxID=1447883 RepID=A0A2B7YSJ3_POLH7|nr:hypothetical protein AJ80_01388 [Polytolypa hystricis UAMH7299]